MSNDSGVPFLRYRCKACGYTYTEHHYFPEVEYGMLDLYCDQCGKQTAVNTFRDLAWDLLETKHKLEFGSETNKPDKMEIFYGWFDESCDKCPCGGTFHIVRAPANLCPRCREDAVEEVERGILEGEVSIPWVTHNEWFKKHRQSDAKQT